MLSRRVTLDAASVQCAKSFETSTINQVTQVSHSWLGKSTFLLSHHQCQAAETTPSFLQPPSAHSTNLPSSKSRAPKASAVPVPSPSPSLSQDFQMVRGAGGTGDKQECGCTEHGPWWDPRMKKTNKHTPLPMPRDSRSSKGRKGQRRREICLATYCLLRSTCHHYKGKQILGIYMVIDRKAPSC